LSRELSARKGRKDISMERKRKEGGKKEERNT